MSDQPSKNGWKILFYLAATVLLGAALAPWLKVGGDLVVKKGWLTHHSVTQSWNQSIINAPFSRFFDRAVMVVALVLLWPTIRWLRFRGWADLGLRRNPCAAMDFTAGALLACGLLLMMGAGFLYSGFFMPDADPKWRRVFAFAVSALVIGLLEEVFFRGAILGVLLRRGTVLAVIVTSVLYAALHFVKAPEVKIDPVAWDSGFRMLGHVFSKFGQGKEMLTEFLTLILIGLVLAFVRLRTKSLWMPIGLHAGWVLGLKLYEEATIDGPRLAQAGVWVGESLKVGLLPLIVILATGVFASLWVDLSRRPVTAESASSS